MLTFPEQFNAAAVFVDSHLEAGRAAKPAILCGDDVVTYGALHERVNRFGNALLALDVRMEERVAILMPDMPELVYAFFGAIKIGAVAVPMNTMLMPPDYQYLLNDCRARILVVHESLLSNYTAIRPNLMFIKHVIVVGGREEGCLHAADIMAAAEPQLAPADTSKDDSAFWLYSSGTTGFPKGTIHLHHDMIVESEFYGRQTIGITEADISFSVAKLFFAYGLGNGLCFPLYSGGTTVLFPGRPTPPRAYEMIDRYQPTVFYGVPTSYAGMLYAAEMAGRTSLGRVRMCVSAGEPLPKTIFERWLGRFGVEIIDGIGSTEILHIFISNRPGQVRPGSTGQIVPGYEAKIVDDAGAELPAGQVGTLLIKGDSIAAGYWNKHDQTKETFRGEWINTHDKFMRDQDGYFWYAGRTDDMIKVSGQAVWPADVESVLQKHPMVLDSGVIGATDRDGLMKVRAFVVLKDKAKASPELAAELQEFVKQNTAKHKYPRTVTFVDELPKTPTGKTKRYLLRKRALEEQG